MKTIQVLGTGCPKCKKLFELAEKTVSDNHLDCKVVKVENIVDIMNFGVMMTPALAVDGDVKVSGKIPTVAEILSYIS